MFRSVFSILMWLVWLGTPALSGAWLQEQGKTFTSLSATPRISENGSYSDTEGTAYFEKGATATLTFGADMNAKGDGYGHAIAFLRRPLGPTDKQGRMAYQFGFGARYQIGVWDSVFRLGLSYGRGTKVRSGFGWLTVDGTLELGTSNGNATAKIDAAWGMPLTDRLKTVTQIETTHWYDAETSIAVTPSVLWEFRSDSFLQLGVEARKSRADTLGIKIGLWRNF